MKINANTTQKLAKEEMKKKDIQETRAAQTTNKKLEKNKNIDTSEIKNNPLSQNIKNTNSNIGRLQIAQKTLNSIESDAKKIAKLAQESKETLDKGEQEDLKEEMSALKKNVESAIKKATFEEINIFSKNIKDNKERIIFDAPKLNIKLLDSDAQKFYDVLKEQQVQIKDAIQILQEQAQESSDKLANGKINSTDTQNTNGSFLKKFGSLFRVSHDTDKLSNQRVQELLT